MGSRGSEPQLDLQVHFDVAQRVMLATVEQLALVGPVVVLERVGRLVPGVGRWKRLEPVFRCHSWPRVRRPVPSVGVVIVVVHLRKNCLFFINKVLLCDVKLSDLTSNLFLLSVVYFVKIFLNYDL